MPRKTIRCTNHEVGEHLVRHINIIYKGSVPAYCAANNINYSGLCKALKGDRKYSQEQVAPIMFDKKKETFFEKKVEENNAD